MTGKQDKERKRAEDEYMNICKRILGEEIPFVDINRKQGFFRRLSNIFKNN